LPKCRGRMLPSYRRIPRYPACWQAIYRNIPNWRACIVVRASFPLAAHSCRVTSYRDFPKYPANRLALRRISPALGTATPDYIGVSRSTCRASSARERNVSHHFGSLRYIRRAWSPDIGESRSIWRCGSPLGVALPTISWCRSDHIGTSLSGEPALSSGHRSRSPRAAAWGHHIGTSRSIRRIRFVLRRISPARGSAAPDYIGVSRSIRRFLSARERNVSCPFGNILCDRRFAECRFGKLLCIPVFQAAGRPILQAVRRTGSYYFAFLL
jgi:hypothetical protein